MDDRVNEIEPTHYEEFEGDNANIYQFSSTLIYVLYGQLTDEDKDGVVISKYLPSQMDKLVTEQYGILNDVEGRVRCVEMV